MKTFMEFSQRSWIVICSKLKTFLGAVLCVLFLIFAILSIPVYLFRFVVIQLAKWFRPDLGHILNGQSGIFITDYFAKTAPRSNIIIVLHCQGIITYEDVKHRVTTRLVQARDKLTGELLFDKLQHYPITWLGFSFWKKAYSTFCVDDHVHRHSGTDTLFTEDQLTDFVQTLLNTRFSKKKSPWEFHVIENYQRKGKTEFQKKQVQDNGGRHAVILFKIHHCLSDGTGILRLLIDGMLDSYSIDELKRPKPRKIERTFSESLLFWLSFPGSLIAELSYMYSHYFRGNPWNVADKDKKWKQVYAKSDLMSIDLIKDIKNTFGVSFTSVLLSLISSAIQKSTGTGASPGDAPLHTCTWPCLSVLPVLGNSKNRNPLENHLTAAIFDFPSASFPSPLERLQTVFQLLENSRNSVVPYVFQIYSTLIGAHFPCVGSGLGKNRQFPIALTNFAATPENDMKLHEHASVYQVDSAVGGLSGNIGVVIAAVSHNGHIRINITAEEAIMTQAEAKQFTKYVNEEIEALQGLMLMKKRITKRENF